MIIRPFASKCRPAFVTEYRSEILHETLSGGNSDAIAFAIARLLRNKDGYQCAGGVIDLSLSRRNLLRSVFR